MCTSYFAPKKDDYLWTSICCFCQVTVKGIDYGVIETVPLSNLCELPPSLRDIPPQVKEAKLAGLRKKQGMTGYPYAATSYLIALKHKRQVLKKGAVFLKTFNQGLFILYWF